MDFRQLRESDPESLTAVIAQWDKTCRTFDTVKVTATGKVGDVMRTGTWRGESATSALTKVKEQEDQLVAGHTEANAIKQILISGQALFRKAKQSLDKTVAEANAHEWLTVEDSGKITITPPQRIVNAGMLPLLKASQEATAEANRFRDRMQRAIVSASYADLEVAKALRAAAAVGGPNDWAFNGKADPALRRLRQEVPGFIEKLHAKDGRPMQDVYPAGDTKVNPTEKELYDSLGLQGQLDAAQIKKMAQIYAQEHADDGLGSGNADALRHAVWNAMLAQRFGEDTARRLTDAHELAPTPPGKNLPSYVRDNMMDLSNNDYGLKFGAAHPEMTSRQLADELWKKVKNGELVVNEHGRLAPSG